MATFEMFTSIIMITTIEIFDIIGIIIKQVDFCYNGDYFYNDDVYWMLTTIESWPLLNDDPYQMMATTKT